jgi:hypothetical protein
MTETEAYLQLFTIIGLIMSVPFLWRICFLAGKLFIVKFFPPKFIIIEIKKANGDVVNETISLEDDEALVDALLRSTGKAIK